MARGVLSMGEDRAALDQAIRSLQTVGQSGRSYLMWQCIPSFSVFASRYEGSQFVSSLVCAQALERLKEDVQRSTGTGEAGHRAHHDAHSLGASNGGRTEAMRRLEEQVGPLRIAACHVSELSRTWAARLGGVTPPTQKQRVTAPRLVDSE